MGNADSKQSGKIEIQVKTRTYTKESCGLFDYQSKDYKQQEFEIDENGIISLYKDEVVYLKNEVIRKDVTNLVRCEFKDNCLYASHTKKQYISLEGFNESKIKARKDYHERFIWRSIDNESGGESIDKGDIFRMGRMRFRVREIEDDKGNRHLGYKGIDQHIEYKEHENQEEIYCRVCMEPQNPAKEFANVCDCSKRMPIHADCLMDWVKTKVNKKVTEAYEFYTWKGLDCDICKKPYPEYFTANSKRYDLMAYEKPDCKFIVLDLFNKDNNTLRGCFVIKRNRQFIRIGRGQECDIRLSDISISRNHCLMTYRNGTFYINDCGSKFGTLMMIRNSIKMSLNSDEQTYQIGKCVLSLVVKRSEAKCIGICGG